MMPLLEEIKLTDVVFDEALYPRKEHDPVLVQKYADCIEAIEIAGKFIALTTDRKLLDGKHRWLAYRKTFGDDPNKTIQAFVYPTATPHGERSVKCILSDGIGWRISFPRTWESDDDKIEAVSR